MFTFQFFDKRTISLGKVNLSRLNDSIKSVFRISDHYARLIVTLEISNITHLNSNDACDYVSFTKTEHHHSNPFITNWDYIEN